MPQLLKPTYLDSVLRNKRSHHNEKPVHHNAEQPPLTATRESPRAATKTQRSQKKKKKESMTLTEKSVILHLCCTLMDNMVGWVVWIEFILKALVEKYNILIIGIIKNIVWINIVNYIQLNFKLRTYIQRINLSLSRLTTNLFPLPLLSDIISLELKAFFKKAIHKTG